MAEATDNRGTKRTNAQRGADLGKRRAPYALRACEACRRRKGKCDGQHPCGHCVGRGQNCNFNNGNGPGEWSDFQPLANDGDLVTPHQMDEQGNPSITSSGREPTGSDGQPHRQTGQCYYGPTSPDYSLNVAQMKIREGSLSASPSKRKQLASIEDEDASDDDSGIAGVDGGGISRDTWPPRNQADYLRLQQFRSLMNLQEATRLLLVYQEVVGDFHPILDLDDFMGKTRVWYTGETSAHSEGRTYSPRQVIPDTDENDLLILNIALAIALRAELTLSSTSSSIERLLQSNFQNIVNAKVVSPGCSIKDVKIILLTVKTERTDASIVMCSIVILDRQLSASTGLPTNFQHSDFEPLPKSSIKNPYLKAMIAFTLISDKFNDPISSAAKGEMYEDQDEFDVMNFQVEQWRKKAVDNQLYPQPAPEALFLLWVGRGSWQGTTPSRA
ncbi:hypothetical protein G7Z17_g4577 [Cylindrodendrum hubeiense]|uniref:Zn(2)-C6 fungal-type domain-containing protein n=1 Tax=Cylindrodendrum hubeiense TaxID=595255 RepID=A0A9P5HIV0_9HYPO|nr:hypothetical protein G7Z17_g4577 [Cylindrodendrum hubeiense]